MRHFREETGGEVIDIIYIPISIIVLLVLAVSNELPPRVQNNHIITPPQLSRPDSSPVPLSNQHDVIY